MRTRAVAHALSALLLVTACGDQVGTTTGDVDLDGRWHLVSGRDAGGAFELAGRQVTLEVRGQEAGGTSACNLYSGTVTVAGQDVSFGGLGGTEMACEPAVMALEQRYLEALGAVRHGRRSGDALRLSGPDITLELSLAPPVEDADLVGTTWDLESLVDGETVSSVAVEGDLRFLESGLLVAALGCGTHRARYELDGDVVTLSELTDRAAAGACPPDVEAQHVHALDVLGDGFTVHVEGDRLTLTGQQGKGLEFRAR